MSQSARGCPYLTRVGNEVHYPIQGYCQRSKMCALRVVTIAEFRLFCSTSNYYHCSIYRFATESANYHGSLFQKNRDQG